MIGILKMRTPIDPDIVSDTAVLVYNTITYVTAVSDSDGGQAVFLIVPDFFDGFIVINTHQITAYDGSTDTDSCANADHTALYTGRIDNTSFSYDCFFQRGATYFCRR